jgi:ankyrin repeat protein
VLKWIIKTWTEYGRNVKNELGKYDSNGMNPLITVCHRGSIFNPHELNLKTKKIRKEVKLNRKACIDLLIKEGADVNAVTPNLKMTALHWATFNGDRQLVYFLLSKGAEIKYSMQNYTPIDIAGIGGSPKIVRAFADFVSKKVPKNKILSTQQTPGNDERHNSRQVVPMDDKD